MWKEQALMSFSRPASWSSWAFVQNWIEVKQPELLSDSWFVTQLKPENSVWAAVWGVQIAIMLVIKENYYWRREFCVKKLFLIGRQVANKSASGRFGMCPRLPALCIRTDTKKTQQYRTAKQRLLMKGSTLVILFNVTVNQDTTLFRLRFHYFWPIFSQEEEIALHYANNLCTWQ